jgi:hypothetical protein
MNMDEIKAAQAKYEAKYAENVEAYKKAANPAKVELVAFKKDFSTQSQGWSFSGQMMINGVMCQVSFNATALGTKPAAVRIEQMKKM